ncbi:MAG: ComEC/Rec2 family competence protein [Clostridia bacterium]|nr:ComEC/Rec2 family competence protein [Clostridia bacterium]
MKKFINFRPIFYLAIALCIGILTGYYFDFSSLFISLSLIIFTVLVLALTIILSKSNKKVYAIFSAIFALIFVIGFFNYSIRVDTYSNSSLGGHTLTVNAKVVEVNEYESAKRLILDKASVSGALNGDIKEKISVYAYGSSNIDLGDRIEFTAKINDNSIYYDNHFRANDIAENIKYSANISASEIKIIANQSNLFEKAHIFIRDTLRRGLSDNEFSVAYAMLLGNTDTMNEDILENFRALGVAHIFAVSGLHVGFIATALAFILKKIKIKSIFKILITALIIFFYAGVCGFSASSVRASIMSIVLLSVNYAGKKYDRLSTLGLSAIIILIYSPLELFRVGFQLSFIVVFGIMTCSKLFARPFKFLGEKVSSLLGGVLSAQVFSLPVCLTAFGKVGVLSIIANLIVLPIISFVFIFLLVSVLIGEIFSIPTIALYLVGLILKGIIFISTAFNYTALTFGGITFGGFILLYYIFFFISAGYVNLTKLVKRITLIVMSAIIVVGTTCLTVFNKNATTVRVIGEYNAQQILVEKGNETTLFVVYMYGNGSVYKALKELNKLGDNKIENLVFLSGFEMDIQHAVTEIYTKIDIGTVYWYEEDESTTKLILEKCFAKTKFIPIDSGSKISICGDNHFNYFALGRAVNFTVDKINFSVYSRLTSTSELSGLNINKNSRYVVANNLLENVQSFNPNARVYSFLSSSGYENAQDKGSILLEI